MFRDIPIKFLLVAGFLFSGLLPLMVVALMSLSVVTEELNHQAFMQLESVRDIKKSQLESFFQDRIRLSEVLAKNPYVHQAFHDFRDLIDGNHGIGRTGFQGYGENKFSAPEAYLQLHAKYYDFFKSYIQGYQYYDVFLMSAEDGFTYLTVIKEADFGIAIAQVDSSLKDVWTNVLKSGSAAVSDTRPYIPSHGIPAQFIAAPIREKGEIVGVVAVQISLDAIAHFMGSHSGMGKTGETYLVGPDYRMRSDSYLDQENHSVVASFAGTVAKNGVRSKAVQAAFLGNSGAQKIVNYNNTHVLSAYAPVKFQSVTWAIIAEINQAEIDEKISTALNTPITIIISISFIILLILAFSISMFISKGVGRVKAELHMLIDNVLSGKDDRIGNPDAVAYDFRGVLNKTNELVEAYRKQILESKRLEEVVAYNQRMESLGTLAGGIAHDFNNILAYMITYCDLVYEHVDNNKQVQDWVAGIMSGIDRAGELVAQIMVFGRQLKQDKRPVELALIMKEATKLLKASIPPTITMRREVKCIGSKVMADPTQLHRVIVNLCANALQAMAEHGGTLQVILDEATINEGERMGVPAGRYSVLQVVDTGSGIEPDIINRITDPFFTTKPIAQGSGMGLSVVHGIVSSYNGALIFDSKPAIGTTVSVYLPLCDETIIPEDTIAHAKVIHGTGRILFIDDEEAVCASTALMIESLGYQVEAKTDAQEALNLFKQQPDLYDVIVTDVTMPTLNGVELAQIIRAIRPTLPILFVTGYNKFVTEKTVKELQAELLLKPFKKSVFSKVLADLMIASVNNE